MFNLEWLLIRLFSLYTLFGMLLDLEIIFFIVGFLFMHISLGIGSIFYDYVHVKKLKCFYTFLVKILSIEITKHLMELFF
uniref:succinate dehydrogenase subunit 4 n=1 Tax=Hypnea cornuta TaxID=105603 RepID=UPI00300382EA|nr:succinate dehydrogenase subunit 4 [Hypnea cornuta]